MRVAIAKPLDEILEKELQQQVFDLAQATGWKRGYHTFDSRRSASGFPDLVLVRERIIYLELKREKTKTTAEQRDWLASLVKAAGEAYLIRPRNLEQIAIVLATHLPLGSWANAGVAATIARDALQAELRAELDEHQAAAMR